ncbi:MAG: hypothetical protein R3C56_23915 [Pirellulaceae bacterium]
MPQLMLQAGMVGDNKWRMEVLAGGRQVVVRGNVGPTGFELL